MNAAEATAVVEGLAARGHVIGDGHSTGTSGGVYAHHNPATGVLQAEVPLGGAAEVDAAVVRAREARATWRAVPMAERMAILYRLADLLDAHDDEACAINALDNGTPVSAMRSGAYTAAWTRYYAGWIDKLDGEVVPVAGDVLDVVLPEPYGVVGAIVPWNGPMMGMGQKAVPALAAGNTVVVKPPELAPFGALRFAELALEAGLPPGALNVVVGGAAAGDALVRHAGIDKVSFTGGCATARLVMAAAAETLTPLTFELGGKSANIVFPDADLEVASIDGGDARRGAAERTGMRAARRASTCTTTCTTTWWRAWSRRSSRCTVGDPFDPSVLMGPVVNAAACERILGVIARAVDEGAGTLLTGGRRLDGDLADGYFVAPTVFGDVDHDSSLAREEIFGPVLSVLRFHDEDEVVAKANDSRLRAVGLRAHPRRCARAAGRTRTRGRHRRRQRLPRHVTGCAVRGCEAERLRPRGRSRRHRGVRPPQEHRLRLTPTHHLALLVCRSGTPAAPKRGGQGVGCSPRMRRPGRAPVGESSRMVTSPATTVAT